MIKIDGSYCEGGGQIARTALALSTLTHEPVEVFNIRKGRCDAGLKTQHMYCIKALEELCNAKSEGASLGSQTIKYFPNEIKGHTLSVNFETAGSITLFLQALLLPCFFADSKVRLKLTGGTDVTWSMPFDYFNNILVPHVKPFCENIDVKLLKRGYFPKGNGKVDIIIKPRYKLSEFKDFNDCLNHIRQEKLGINLMDQGELVHVTGISHASSDLQKAEVAERQARSAKLTLAKLGCPIQISTEYCDTLSSGSGITLWAIFSKPKQDVSSPVRIGADSLGERGKRAELVGKEAAERLINEINYKAPVDEYMADNLMPFLALFGGQVKVAKLSNHTRTNMFVVEQFLGKTFSVKDNVISVE